MSVGVLHAHNRVGFSTIAPMTVQTRYRDYRLTSASTPEFGGSFRSRVALVAVKPGRPLSQRFVDFEVFSTKAEADQRAIEGGKHWIDDQQRIARITTFKTEYDTLA